GLDAARDLGHDRGPPLGRRLAELLVRDGDGIGPIRRCGAIILTQHRAEDQRQDIVHQGDPSLGEVTRDRGIGRPLKCGTRARRATLLAKGRGSTKPGRDWKILSGAYDALGATSRIGRSCAWVAHGLRMGCGDEGWVCRRPASAATVVRGRWWPG